MAFVFSKFREAINAFSRNPRQLQLETDINLLFLYTSYKRLGKAAEEAELNEIIDMACKASVADQQTLVQENIHRQIHSFCNSMDTILLEDSPLSPTRETPVSRASGLSLAIRNTAQTNRFPGLRESKPISREEVSASLKGSMGYTLAVEPSRIPHKEAGEGLFVKGEAEVGSIIAFYPGMVYEPAHYRYIPGYPTVGADNPYLIARYDDTVIDAKPWGKGGECREKWRAVDSACETQVSSGSDRVWKMLSKPLVGEGEIEVLERRNPLALGQFANHPGKGIAPNVMVCPYDFPLEEKGMRVYIPNARFGRGDDVAMRRYGRFWFRMGRREKREAIGRLKCLVLVATRDVRDEEVLLNYRLSNAKRRPAWYVPVDEEEDSRRWS